MKVYIDDMEDKDFKDYPDDTIFVLSDDRSNRKFDPVTCSFYYEIDTPTESKENKNGTDA